MRIKSPTFVISAAATTTFFPSFVGSDNCPGGEKKNFFLFLSKWGGGGGGVKSQKKNLRPDKLSNSLVVVGVFCFPQGDRRAASHAGLLNELRLTRIHQILELSYAKTSAGKLAHSYQLDTPAAKVSNSQKSAFKSTLFKPFHKFG